MKKVTSSEKVAVSFSLEKETDTLRKSGIEAVGNIPWGTHLCQFYETKEDLVDILLPYFKAGLESNEFCMWVTSEPLSVKEAEKAMRKAVPNVDLYLKRGQIEIVPHTEWYLKDGAFNLERVLDAWVDKLNQALAEGYDGIRVTGNTAWLEKKDWRNFADYEEEVNRVIGKFRMMAICTYSLDKCGASEVIDVVRNHQFALVRRRGEWEIIESSELKQTKEALRRSEMRLKKIFAASPDAITVSDLNGNIVECNQAALGMGGFSSKDDVIGKNALEFIAKKDYQRAMENLKKMLEQGSVRNVEYTFLAKDGREYTAELSASVIKDSSGNPTGFVVVTKDITERKKAEEQLRDSETRYRTLYETIKDGIVAADMNGHIVECNQAYAEMLGYSKDELKRMTLQQLTPKKWHQCAYARAEQVLERGYSDEYEKEYTRKDGTVFPVSIRGWLIRDKDGKPKGIWGMARDITERNKAEDALGESEEKFRNIFESANDCFIYLDRSGRILEVNRKAAEVFGGSKKEVLGKHFTKLGVFSPKDIPKVMTAFASGLAGKDFTLNICIKNKKNQEIPLECSTSVMKMDGKLAGVMVIARDVTQRKKTEGELIRLSSAVKMSTDSIVISDLDGKIIDVNEATLKMYGTDDKGDLIGKSSFDLIAPEDLEKALAGAKEVLEKGYVKGREYHIMTKDGGRIPVEMSVAIMKDGDGKPIGFVGISRDISERKRAEEALRKSEERYRSIVELAPDIIVTSDMKGVITSINAAGTRVSGYSKDEVVGKQFSKIGHLRPKDLPKYLNIFNSVVRGKAPKAFETGFYHKDGTPRLVEVRLSLMKKNGKTTGIQAIIRDITERKKMEEKLRQYSEHLQELVQKRTEELSESEKRYSVLVEEASDGVIILQGEEIAFANKKALEIVGYSRDKLIGLPFEKLVDEKYRQHAKERCLRRIRGEEISTTYEMELIARTGERVPVEVSCARIRDQGRYAILQIVRDIRERKRMEEQRLKLEKLATMGELATMVAHDLRNPLTSIRTASYYIKNTCPHHADAECKTALEMFDIIEKETLFADNIVNDLLDFATKRSLQKKRQNINNLIEASLTKSKIPENIKVKRKFAKKATATIDGKQLERVFLNLVKNVVQAMPDGGKLTIKTSETKDYIEIAFTDTGVGITEENMSKLFQPLFTTKAKGIGMGLAICKRIVEQHGGTINVQSKVGKGTTITIKLPKKEEENNR